MSPSVFNYYYYLIVWKEQNLLCRFLTGHTELDLLRSKRMTCGVYFGWIHFLFVSTSSTIAKKVLSNFITNMWSKQTYAYFASAYFKIELLYTDALLNEDIILLQLIFNCRYPHHIFIRNNSCANEVQTPIRPISLYVEWILRETAWLILRSSVIEMSG